MLCDLSEKVKSDRDNTGNIYLGNLGLEQQEKANSLDLMIAKDNRVSTVLFSCWLRSHEQT